MQGAEDRQLMVGRGSRFEVVFKIEPGPPSEIGEDAEKSEDEVLQELKRRDGDLRTKLNDIAHEHPLSFDVTSTEYRQGSIELVVLLGLLYSGIKDYETVRNSLQALIRDMRGVIGTVLNDVSPQWSVAPGSIRATSVTVREQWAPEDINAANSYGSSMSNTAARALQLRRWIATYWGVLLAALYLVVTNIVLIVFLGLLVLRLA